ncbi:methyl-accepting chemotaxis protein [Gracilibacillus caseinilyticus]|uniref:Methyl-accepting chemotaxis protein n=1 Tax=Gracilibacillus caseinilyticus TaxID=2932256 RepID=A0ABY4F227_9BACI|nr:methyl-accepting chemotaxis protein [Gracilibacillus caseinilyticus]UOQ50117.1 methyl-accepting chemotaxis protein [Gracilibacillus caseinilyticus]
MNAFTKFRQLPIRSKFLILFLLLFIWFGIIQVVQFFFFTNYMKQYNEMTETVHLTNSIHGQLRKQLEEEIRDIVYGKVYFEEGQQYQILSEMKQHLDAVADKDTAQPFSVEIKEVRSVLTSTTEYVDRLGNQIKFNASAEEKYITQEYIGIASELINDHVQTLLQKTLQESEQQKIEMKENINRNIIISIVVFLLLVIISFFIIWNASNRTLKPIYSLQNYAREIAKGNLNVSIKPVTATNEIDDLYNGFHVMTDYLKHIISQVNQTSNEIIYTSHQIHLSTEDNLSAGEQITSTTQLITQDLHMQNIQLRQLQQENLKLLQEQLQFEKQLTHLPQENHIKEHTTITISMIRHLQQNLEEFHKQITKCMTNMGIIGTLGEEQLTTIEEIAEYSDKQLTDLEQLQQHLRQFKV